jgi:16S rRNA (cytosine1402-N4)-methyltransferase
VRPFVHKPVMLAEVVAVLRPAPGACWADGTLGGGGHAAALLAASSPSGWLYGCDRDGAALEAARMRLAEFAGRFELRQDSFSGLAEWVPPGRCDGVLFDLGVSSPQLDWPERGFSFQAEGKLDMRMDPRSGPTAADLLNTLPAVELADLFWRLGEERDSRRLARAVEQERRLRRLETTRQLAELVERVKPRQGRKTHPATQIFQALRLAVNDELGALREGLEAAMKILKPGGRLAVITFHSLEDRIVKEFGQTRARDYEFEGPVDVPELRRPRRPEVVWVNRKPLPASLEEVAANPRSRSAKLRVLEKL